MRSRGAAARRDVFRRVLRGEQPFDDLLVVGDVAFPADVREDPLEVRDRRALGEHLVVDAAEKRFVHQFGRSDVRGEHDEHHEGQLEFLTGLERQEVDAALERHDPAVQQVARRAPLTAEIVDDQNAAVGNCLDRR